MNPVDDGGSMNRKATGRDAKGRYLPGHSGNPKGRDCGVVNRHRQMLNERGDLIIAKLFQLGEEGDVQALKWLGDRLMAPVKARSQTVSVQLEGDTSAKAHGILAAMAEGRVTPDEGLILLNGLRLAVEISSVAEMRAELDELREKIR